MNDKQILITLKISNKVLPYSGDKSLLEFLESQNIDIDSACREGRCGSCEVKIKSGEIEYLENGYLSAKEKSKGKRLSCISFPKGDLEIDL